jgi:hypothetical protein
VSLQCLTDTNECRRIYVRERLDGNGFIVTIANVNRPDAVGSVRAVVYSTLTHRGIPITINTTAPHCMPANGRTKAPRRIGLDGALKSLSGKRRRRWC